MYNLKELSLIFNITYKTLSNKIRKKEWNVKNKGWRRYYITETDVIQLIINEPKYQWLLQKTASSNTNSRERIEARKILSLLQEEYPDIKIIYSYNEICQLLKRSISWYDHEIQNKNFSARYIRHNELVNYLKHHRHFIQKIRFSVCNDKRIEMIRFSVLSDLVKEGDIIL